MLEIWENIRGYEGLYQVSNYGRIKSLHKNGKIINGYIDGKGYMHVALSKNGKKKWFRIHRLVAQAFIPNHDNLPIINHKDENKLNNRVDNLEWCTTKYNNCYGTRVKRVSKAMKGRKFTEEHKAKLKDNHSDFRRDKNPNHRKVRCITTGEIFDCIIDAANKYNVFAANITKCCRGKSKHTGRDLYTNELLEWEYLEED